MDIINKLKQIGLPSREAEVYLALLQKNEFTAPELTKITNVTRTKIYELLQNLIHKGACNESYRNGQKIFKAIKPELAIKNIISNYENEIERRKKNEIEQMKQAGISIEKELASLHENNINKYEPIDYIEVLTDKEQIRERYMSFIKKTKKELFGFTKPPYAANFSESVKGETVSIKNKTIIKGIYEYKDLTPEEIDNLIKGIEAYQKIGEEVRIIKELPFKLLISDETVTMFALNDRISLKPSITSIVIDHPNFAKVLKEVFENYWAKSFTIKEFKKNKSKYLNSK
jgi:HTH-type transcriptional regulator, sugar sensing transcriptional regulator